jgi:hypothetical protein
MVQSKGGRFVRLKDNVWSVIPAKTCRLKVAHAIQYHIRNELSTGKDLSSIPTDVIINSQSGVEDHLSVNQLIVEDIKAKLSWLQMQEWSSDLANSYPIAQNHALCYNSRYDLSVPMNGDNVRSQQRSQQRDHEVTSRIAHHRIVQPKVEVPQIATPSCDTNCDDITRHPKYHFWSAQSNMDGWCQPPSPPTNPGSTRMSNGSRVLRLNSAFLRSSPVVDTNGKGNFHETTPPSQDESVLQLHNRYASLPVRTERMDYPKCTIRDGYPRSDAAHTYCFENTGCNPSLDSAYHVTRPSHPYHSARFNQDPINHTHDRTSTSIGTGTGTALGMTVVNTYPDQGIDTNGDLDEGLIDRSIIHAMIQQHHPQQGCNTPPLQPPVDWMVMEDRKVQHLPTMDSDFDSIGTGSAYSTQSHDADIGIEEI